MDLGRTLSRGGRRGTIALVLAVVLALGGGSALVWAATHQQQAPQPPASAAGTAAGRTSSAPPTHPSPTAPATSPSAPPPENSHLPASTPTAVSIPAIHVHSSLQELGLDPDGTVQTPQPGPHYDQAGWFTGSATPGQLGVSVILGHIDSAANGPSVFFRLGALRPGDEVLVDRADGRRATFTVDSLQEFPKSHFPTVQVYRGDPDRAGLRLITCGGPFDSAARSYLDNIVVYATLTGVS